MALKEWNMFPGVTKETIVENASVTAVAGAASTLGGTYSVRVLIDDVVALSRSDVDRAIDIFQQALKQDTWPPTLVSFAPGS